MNKGLAQLIYCSERLCEVRQIIHALEIRGYEIPEQCLGVDKALMFCIGQIAEDRANEIFNKIYKETYSMYKEFRNELVGKNFKGIIAKFLKITNLMEVNMDIIT